MILRKGKNDNGITSNNIEEEVLWGDPDFFGEEEFINEDLYDTPEGCHNDQSIVFDLNTNKIVLDIDLNDAEFQGFQYNASRSRNDIEATVKCKKQATRNMAMATLAMFAVSIGTCLFVSNPLLAAATGTIVGIMNYKTYSFHKSAKYLNKLAGVSREYEKSVKDWGRSKGYKIFDDFPSSHQENTKEDSQVK